MKLEITPAKWKKLIFVAAMGLFGALTQAFYSWAWVMWAGVIAALYLTYTEVVTDARRQRNEK